MTKKIHLQGKIGRYPQIALHRPDPDYLRSLVERTGLSQRRAAREIGVSERMFRYYLSGEHECPYHVQYTLEGLAT